MLVLLPPSETKTGRRRGRPLDLTRLSFPELTAVREKVLEGVVAASERDDATDVFEVPPSLAGEVARNRVLRTAPALPALDCYTGVLYDALGYPSLTGPARRRANRWLVVVSAVYGAVRPTDHVTPYRCRMGVDVPGVGPLAPLWREHLDEVLSPAAGSGLVVDCRSTTYATVWRPRAAAAGRWVKVAVPGASHLAKHTRGLLARQLCLLGAEPRTPQALAEAVDDAFVTDLAGPAAAGRPWTLNVTPRPNGPCG
ncbi:conserved hypothetical protein [Nostocoides japonicum T1-X7]|uniref:Uncharacterized protein n=1 Tax=Nostocoides japonicum T1-X7 TaxID=1194083 RepID=A0A077M289_9MICO|nr:peroxide stress protein YaaA [Tetrasphaera japonica]CCH78320.1 conserved hypothetical protein [Tetrasphaera japonica T1-X7]